MTDPSDDLIPLDRWSVPLDEPDLPAVAPPPPAADEPTPDVLRFPMDVEGTPGEGFQPRLTRFGKAG
jgi:hypothetical protein